MFGFNFTSMCLLLARLSLGEEVLNYGPTIPDPLPPPPTPPDPPAPPGSPKNFVVPLAMIMQLRLDLKDMQVHKPRGKEAIKGDSRPNLFDHADEFGIPFNKASSTKKELTELIVQHHVDYWTEKGSFPPNICHGRYRGLMYRLEETSAQKIYRQANAAPPAVPNYTSPQKAKTRSAPASLPKHTVNKCMQTNPPPATVDVACQPSRLEQKALDQQALDKQKSQASSDSDKQPLSDSDISTPLRYITPRATTPTDTGTGTRRGKYKRRKDNAGEVATVEEPWFPLRPLPFAVGINTTPTSTCTFSTPTTTRT